MRASLWKPGARAIACIASLSSLSCGGTRGEQSPASSETEPTDTGGGSGGLALEPEVPVDCNLPDCDDPRHQCTICRIADECECPGGEPCSWGIDSDLDGARIPLTNATGAEPGAFAVCSQTRFFDCDDTDPDHYYPGYADADADGFAGEQRCTYPGEPGVMQFLPSRSATFPEFDCDDSDPDRNQILYFDADGDGWGDPERPGCEVHSAGYVFSDRDCDDEDPEVPAVIEIWGDEIDSDCDGIDGTLGPESDGNDWPECWESPELVASSCAGVDLTLNEPCGQHNCPAWRILTISNVGAASYSGRVSLFGPFTETSAEISITLEPGETTDPFTFWSWELYDAIELSVEETEDCNETNNPSPYPRCHTR